MNNNKRKYPRKGKVSDGIKSRNDKFDRKPSDKVKEESFNDPSWYVANGQLLKDFASLSFNNALGAKSRIGFHQYDTLYEGTDLVYTSPGIMAIYTAPSFGISEDGSSAVNLAAKNFYTWIRHQNSGHVNYDSPDLMMYFGAMDSIYSLLASMIRAYGTARAFSQVNRYIGDTLLSAQGYNAGDIRNNLADFRGYINMVITKVSAFCTPVTMSMFKRHFWMYSGIYRDENVIKSQSYLYVPAILWKYDETDGPGHLLPTLAFATQGANLAPSTKTFNQLRSLMDSLLSAIVSSEDINIMSGDILKAYGRENLWTLSMLTEDYVVFPVSSEEVLDQIHNTTFAGATPVSTLDLTTTPTISLDRLGVIQDPQIGDGAIYFVPQFLNAAHLGYDAVIDMHKDEPTPEDVMVATRNILTAKIHQIEGTNNTVAQLTGCGSDICMFGRILTINNAGTGNEWTAVYTDQNPYSTGVWQKLSTFNKYPRYISVDQYTKIPSLNGEIDNYTVISHDDMQRMHDSATLSLMGVPFLGTGSKS